MHYAKNKSVPKIIGLLAFGLLAIPTFAEEPSEHVATGISGTQISGYVSTSASWYLYPRPQVLMPLPTTGNAYFSTESFRALYPYPGPESSFAQQLAGSGGYYGIGVNANARMSDGDSHGLFSLSSVSAIVDSDASRFELSVAAVPEPNVIALLGLGAGAVIARLRKKRNG